MRPRLVLADAGLYVLEAEVLVVDFPDTPGMLGTLSQALADAQCGEHRETHRS